MIKLSETALVGRMRDIYRQRLQNVLSEVKVRDEAGNILISPGLKVRHGETGFEYTVDSVSEDPSTKQVSVTLRKPEVPRFDPPGEHFVGESDSTGLGDDMDMSHVDRLMSTFGETLGGDQDESSVTFVVNQDDFEKDYDLELSNSSTDKKKTNSSSKKNTKNNSVQKIVTKKSSKGAKR